MECTQRLECTQELYASQNEAVCPEQIGFLGICGTKYPVKRGPNKIGRDSSVCSIVLNLDSISRNHAVINIINGTEYMLMDLDSANKTRLNNKVLQPYISYPLNNCDTVQFGTVFGVFRLLVEDHELPSTQAMDIPDTPAHYRQASRVKGAATTIPESPDVSDRDDSFIMPSQPKEKQPFKSPNTAKYIKNSSRTAAMQPIDSHPIDNVFWNSNKKSLSIDDSGSFNDDLMVTANTTCQDDINEMETQPPFINKTVEPNDSIYTAKTQTQNISRDSIYTADTQFPNDVQESIFTAATQLPGKVFPSTDINEMQTQPPFINKTVDRKDSIYTAETQMQNISRDSIYTADTQFPNDVRASIFTAATQLPGKVSPNTVDTHMPEHLPSVQKISDQHDMQFDIYASNKGNMSVYNAETQLITGDSAPATLKDDFIDEDDNILSASKQFPFNDKNSPNDYENDLSIFEADTQFTTGKIESDNAEQQKGDTAKVKSEVVDLDQDVSLSKTDTQVTASKHDNAQVESMKQKELSEKDNLKADKQETSSTSEKDLASTSNAKLNTTSDEEILFEEIDGQSFEEDFESQPLIPSEEFELMEADPEMPLSQTMLKKSEEETITSDKKEHLSPVLLKADVTVKLSNDSEKQDRKSAEKQSLATNILEHDDISSLPTQKLSIGAADEDDATDCESSDNESNKNTPTKFKPTPFGVHTETLTYSPPMLFEDMDNQILEEEKNPSLKTLEDVTKNVPDAKFDIPVEDMATQVLAAPELVTDDAEISFEDMATQVLEEEDILHEVDTKNYKDAQDRNKDVIILVDDDISNLPTQILPKSNDSFEDLPTQILDIEVPKTNYAGSLEQYSQELVSSFKVPFVAPLKRKISMKKTEPKTIVSPIINSTVTVKTPQNVSNVVPPANDDVENHYDCTQDILEDLSSENQETSNKLQNVTAKVDSQVASLKRASGDSQDSEVTPKKVRPMRLRYLELPDSQEIKTSVSLASRLAGNSDTQSSESEPEQNSEEMTPIVFRKKKKKVLDVKKDLIKKFEASTAPTRVISRVRNPTAKLKESNIFKNKNQTDSQDNVDTEIITENITRLKSKTEKKNKGAESKPSSPKPTVKTEKVIEPKEDSKSSTETNVSIKIEKSPKKVIIKRKGAKKTEAKTVTKTSDGKIKTKLKPEKETKSVKTEKDSDTNKSPKKKNTVKGKNKKCDVKNDLDDNVTESKKNILEPETSINLGKSNNTPETSGVRTRCTRSCRRTQSNTSNPRRSNDRTSSERSATPTVDLTLQPIVTIRRRNQNNSNIADTADTKDLTKNDTCKRKPTTAAKEKQVDETKIAKTEEKTKETRSKAKVKQVKTAEKKTAIKTDPENSVRSSRRLKTDSQKQTIDKYFVDNKKSMQKDTSAKSVDEIDQKSTKRGKSSHEVSTVYSVSSDASISSDNTPLSKKRSAPSHKEIDQKYTKKGQKSHEVSTVCRVSSDASISSDNTPLSKKRSAPSHKEIEAPSPKRTRASRRAFAGRMMKTQHVLFTAFNNNDVKQLLENMGAVVVTDVKACTMVLTLSIKRTFKLLCAVGLGVPIVGPSWVQACLDANMIVDPWQYIIKDEVCENRFQFSLQETLAGKRNFLKGYNVSSTPKVLPAKHEMKFIVECSGGSWKECVPNWICVSNSLDKALWPALVAAGATVVNTEFILCGVLKQVVDVETNRLT